MKLRILGNKIRLRLTQNEISMLEAGDSVSESVKFMNGAIFKYQLSVSESYQELHASFVNNSILVNIPSPLVTNWATDHREGLYHKEEQEDLKFELAIEKDYQCLHRRPDEDESDNFPNPAKSEEAL